MGKNNKKKKQKAKKKQTNTNLDFAVSCDIENGISLKIRVQELIEMLGSQFEEDILCSLATLSGFVLESEGAKIFLSGSGISKVSSFLVHTHAEIREKAIGTLQNIMLTSGEEAAGHLLNNGIANVFMQIFKQANLVFIQCCDNKLLSTEQFQKENKFLVESLHLFTTLCENSASMVDDLDLQTLLEFFHGVLKKESFDMDIKIKAGHCLYTISEDNEKLSTLMSSNPTVLKEYSALADSFIKTNHLLLAILIAGFTYNSSQTPEVTEAILHLISLCLGVDALSALRNELDKEKLKTWENIIEAQCICMEMLSNMLCQGNEDETWEEGDEDDETTNDSSKNAQPDTESLSRGKECVHKFRLLGIPEKVLLKCSGYKEIDPAKDTIESAKRLQTRGWQCMSNLYSATPAEICVPAEVESLWKMTVSVLCNNEGALRDIELEISDAVSSAMRAVVEKALAINSTQIVASDVVRISKAILSQEILDSTRINFVSMLGMIGQIVSQTNNVQILQVIGAVFADVLSKPSLSLLVVAETLDATFDSFADGPCVDSVLQVTNLLQTLKSLAHTIRSRMKSERTSLAENIGIVDMARINLNRFLKYKSR